jgi:hypothetical protein
MNFKDAQSVASIISQMQDSDRDRRENRALINNLFNGNPPFTEDEAEENQVLTNFNDLSSTKQAHDARKTFDNAFIVPSKYFTVTLTEGDPHKRIAWGLSITNSINRIMKRSLAYTNTLRSIFAQVVLHGVGPALWHDQDNWCPKVSALEDLLIPSRTTLDMDNLTHFAVFTRYTPSQLYGMTHGESVDPGWDIPLVEKILAEAFKAEIGPPTDSQSDTPEKLEEAYKANGGTYDTDAAPTINLWRFFHQDEKTGKWFLTVLEDGNTATQKPTEKFLYKSKAPYAESLGEVLHIMFADGANVAPFLYHSVRGLGFLLYALAHVQNRLRCKLTDAAFQDMLWIFRNVGPEDREKIRMVDLQNFGLIPEGISYVPANERYAVNPNLPSAVLGMGRQSMSEVSASFTQDINDGTKREMTATEAMGRITSVNSMVSAMLGMSYTYITFQYREICRRLCKQTSGNKDAQRFMAEMQAAGVPIEALNSELWDISPEKVIGAGNKMLQIAQADKLMAARPAYPPDAQQRILRIFTQVNTDDPQLADVLVPEAEQTVTETTHDAQLSAAALLEGVMVSPRKGMNPIEYVEAQLAVLGQKIEAIEQNGGMADPDDVMGLSMLVQHITANVQQVAQDPAQQQRVKMYEDALGKASNYIKGYIQRLQEQQQAAMESGQQGMTPEAMSKIQGAIMMAQSNAKIKEAAAEQKMRHKELQFMADQRRRDVRVQFENSEKMRKANVENSIADSKGAAEIIRKKREQDAIRKPATTTGSPTQ